jgi:hypothetical protein
LSDGIAEIMAAIEAETIGDYRETRYSNHKSLTSGKAVGVLDGLASPVRAAVSA